MKKESNRFSVFLDSKLLNQLDQLVKDEKFANRSQAIAELVRDKLVSRQGQLGNKMMSGAVVLVYTHHKPNLQDVLTEIQHHYCEVIVSSMHIHLDQHNCLEIIVMKAKGTILQELSERLIHTKGVKYGKLVVAPAGGDI
jgi:CopG family transcriptional regulator, nickel-responsive regulator